MAGPTERKDYAEDDVIRKLNLSPQSTEKQKEKEKEKDPIEEIEAATYRGERLKAFKQAAGIKDQQPQPPTPTTSSEKIGIDIGAIFNSQSAVVTKALDKLSEVKTGPTTDPYLQHLEGELQTLQQKIEAGGVDPIDHLTQTQTKLDALFDSFKKRLGISESANVKISDMPSMIELEKIKIASQEGHDRWTEEMAEKKRRWEVEDRHWLEELELKKSAAANTQKLAEKDEQRKDKAMTRLGDLVGGVIESIETEEGYEAPLKKEKAAQPPAQERIIKPKKFKCTCGRMLDVPADAAEVECKQEGGGCGAIYDMVEVTRQASQD